jgi:hypothetical protein
LEIVNRAIWNGSWFGWALSFGVNDFVQSFAHPNERVFYLIFSAIMLALAVLFLFFIRKDKRMLKAYKYQTQLEHDLDMLAEYMRRPVQEPVTEENQN